MKSTVLSAARAAALCLATSMLVFYMTLGFVSNKDGVHQAGLFVSNYTLIEMNFRAINTETQPAVWFDADREAVYRALWRSGYEGTPSVKLMNDVGFWLICGSIMLFLAAMLLPACLRISQTTERE